VQPAEEAAAKFFTFVARLNNLQAEPLPVGVHDMYKSLKNDIKAVLRTIERDTATCSIAICEMQIRYRWLLATLYDRVDHHYRAFRNINAALYHLWELQEDGRLDRPFWEHLKGTLLAEENRLRSPLIGLEANDLSLQDGSSYDTSEADSWSDGDKGQRRTGFERLPMSTAELDEGSPDYRMVRLEHWRQDARGYDVGERLLSNEMAGGTGRVTSQEHHVTPGTLYRRRGQWLTV